MDARYGFHYGIESLSPEREMMMINHKPKLSWVILLMGVLITMMLSKWILAAQPVSSQPAQPSSNPGAWEYRIVTGALSETIRIKQLVQVPGSPGNPTIVTATLSALEDRIKELTDQGFVVDQLQTLSLLNIDGNASGILGRSEPTIVVLLKRQK